VGPLHLAEWLSEIYVPCPICSHVPLFGPPGRLVIYNVNRARQFFISTFTSTRSPAEHSHSQVNLDGRESRKFIPVDSPSSTWSSAKLDLHAGRRRGQLKITGDLTTYVPSQTPPLHARDVFPFLPSTPIYSPPPGDRRRTA